MIVAEIARLREALAWVLAHDYGDSIVPPRQIADTMAEVAAQFDGDVGARDI